MFHTGTASSAASSRAAAPAGVPILSRGRHRSPRKGACFMELASFLAGERWSDRPSCTHPLLASLARLVNDVTSDGARARLAPLVPDVVGLRPVDPRADVVIALRAAITALPVASADRQRVLALSVLMCLRVLDELDEAEPLAAQDAPRVAQLVEPLRAHAREALADTPDATAWARRFGTRVGVSAKGFRRHGAPNVVRVAVGGLAEACAPDVEEALRVLLATAIEDCRRLVPAEQRTGASDPRWDALCELTGAR